MSKETSAKSGFLSSGESPPADYDRPPSYDKMIRSAGSGEKLDGAYQHLFRISAAGETSAGESFFFDDRDFRAKRVRSFRRVKTSRPAADDD